MDSKRSAKFISAIDAVYDAVIDPTVWSHAVQACGNVTDSLGCHFLAFDNQFTPIYGVIHSDYGQEFGYAAQEAYINEYAAIDFPRVIKFLQTADTTSYRNKDLIDQSTAKSCRLHNEYNREFDCEKQLIFGQKLAGSGYLTVAGSRPNDGSEYEDDDLFLFSAINRHLARSLEMQLKLGNLFGDSVEIQSLTSSNIHPVFVINSSQRVVWCNDIAQKMLLQNLGVSIVKGKLNSKDQYFESSLSKLVRQACTLGIYGKTRPGFTHLKTEASSFVVSVFSSPVQGLLIADNAPLAVVAFKEIDEKPVVPPFEVVSRHFGLSPAETNLALGIASGLTLKEYSDQNELTINTVRSALKIVMGKTNSSRQTELVIKLNSLINMTN